MDLFTGILIGIPIGMVILAFRIIQIYGKGGRSFDKEFKELKELNELMDRLKK